MSLPRFTSSGMKSLGLAIKMDCDGKVEEMLNALDALRTLMEAIEISRKLDNVTNREAIAKLTTKFEAMNNKGDTLVISEVHKNGTPKSKSFLVIADDRNLNLDVHEFDGDGYHDDLLDWIRNRKKYLNIRVLMIIKMTKLLF